MQARVFAALVVVAALGAGARPVRGQAVAAQPVARGDVTLFTGSFSVDTDEIHLGEVGPYYERWAHMALFEASAGYYWTDHLKTEIGALWTTDGETSGNGVITLPVAQVGWVYHTNRFSARQFGIGQHWQFGRNAMFHPWIGAGVDVVHIESELDRPAQFIFVSASPGRPAQSLPIEAAVLQSVTNRALPYAAAGFKAYFSERGFVRTDLKLQLRSGVEQVAWKIGVGVDFWTAH